jgi:S-formylglutathione hydrolase
MESYLLEEWLPLLEAQLPISASRLGLMGHSMGGHGALTLAFRHPGRFRSLSAFAPICAPMQCPWGVKAFTGYLGSDTSAWRRHDATELIRQRHQAGLPPLFPLGMLVDQGLADKFLAEQLHPHLLEQACAEAGQALTLRRHEGYDHGYYFIASFVEDHLRHHAAGL